MNLFIPFYLAIKSIKRSNKATLILTPLIIGLSFINLTFTTALFEGVIKALDDQLINNYISNVVIEPKQDEDYIFQVSTKQNLIESIPGVVGSTSHYRLPAVISFDRGSDGKNIRKGSYGLIGISPAKERKVTQIYKHIIEGEYLTESDRGKILLGVEIAGGRGAKMIESSLKGVQVGDKVTVVFSENMSRKFTVKGVYRTGLDGIDMSAFVNKHDVEPILGIANSGHEIMVKVSKRGSEAKLIKKLKKIGFKHEKIKPWNEFLEMTATMRSSFNILNLIITFVSLVVAAATIFIVIFINVVNKRKQIGILKAIGVNENLIIYSYIIQTFFYLTIGIIIGLLILLFALKPYFDIYPLDMGFGFVSLAILQDQMIAAVINLSAVSLIAGLVPAYRTCKENILKAIWG